MIVPGSVTLVSLGEVSQDLLYWIRDALADSLGCDVTLGDPIPLSVAWYDDERRQYRGTEILRALREVPRQEEDRVLGLADADCYASGWHSWPCRAFDRPSMDCPRTSICSGSVR
jgi:predicted Zn-dependent protease